MKKLNIIVFAFCAMFISGVAFSQNLSTEVGLQPELDTGGGGMMTTVCHMYSSKCAVARADAEATIWIQGVPCRCEGMSLPEISLPEVSLFECPANVILGLPAASEGTEREVSCTAGTAMLPGSTQPNYTGSKTYKCQSKTWTLKTNTCKAMECNPGQTQYEPCDDCGTKTRVCSSSGSFGTWSSCSAL